MGMDVLGRGNPDAYFRANIWSWAPIRQIMVLTCSDFLSYFLLSDMSINGGYGPETQSDCDKIADRIEAFCNERNITRDAGTFRLDLGGSLRVDADSGRFLRDDEPGGVSPYSVEGDHLWEFVDFLRECGGFQVF